MCGTVAATDCRRCTDDKEEGGGYALDYGMSLAILANVLSSVADAHWSSFVVRR